MRPDGRRSTTYPHRRRENRRGTGFEYEHRLVAEKALGKPLPPGVEIHHWRGDRDPRAIVICQDKAYHRLLERRQRAFAACGHADWQRCRGCGAWDRPDNLEIFKRNVEHAECRRRRHREAA